MPNLARVRVAWTGTPVTGPGVSTFYFDESGSGWVADLSQLFTSWRAFIPTGTTMTIDASGDLISDTTGEIVGTWSEAGVPAVLGNGNGTWPQGVGARASWLTSGIRNGRRVRGTTFIVPIVSSSFEGANGLSAGAVSGLGTAAGLFQQQQDGIFRIWSRPTATQAGASHVVINGVVPDTVTWLRSRRT